jgi:hypothetical protein
MGGMLALRVDVEQAHFPGGKSGPQQFTAGAFCVSLLAVTTDNKGFHPTLLFTLTGHHGRQALT